MRGNYKIFALTLAVIVTLTILTPEVQAETSNLSDGIAINDTNFPDSVFKQYILDKVDATDVGSIGILTPEEINNTKKISVFRGYNGVKISSLKGIEHFKELNELDCSSNALEEIDVTNNKALTTLDCSGNKIKTINLRENKSLGILFCSDMSLTSLDVSENTALYKLECSRNSGIGTLNVNANIALKELLCISTGLTTLDVSKNVALTRLECSFNSLTALDISENKKISTLVCGSNRLKTLDISNNTALEYFNCTNNSLTTLDMTQNKVLNFYSTSYDKNNLISVHFPTTYTKTWSNTKQNVKNIVMNSKNQFDFTTLDNKYDVSKIESLSNATLNKEGMLTDLNIGDEFTYTYRCGPQQTIAVAMKVVDRSYPVVINNGTTDLKEYIMDDSVTIQAKDPEAGKKFKEWKVDSGNVTLSNPKSATTSFTMLDESVEVTAIYEDVTIVTTNSTHQNGGKQNLTFTCSGELADLKGIYVDDQLVDPMSYTLKSGSTILTLKTSYLDTLSVGKHILKFVYNNKVFAETELIIMAKEQPNPEEPTVPDEETPIPGKPEEVIPPNIDTEIPVVPTEKPNLPSDVEPNLPSDVEPTLPSDVEPTLPNDAKPIYPETSDTINITVYLCLAIMCGCIIRYALIKKLNK